MKLLNNQKGFAVLELALIVVVIALVGFVGYRAYQARQAKPTANQATQVQVPTYKRTTTAPKDWKTYTNDEYKISLAYPPTWVLTTNTITKKASEDTQNVYSVGATKIFVIGFLLHKGDQSSVAQININNLPLDSALTQLRAYYGQNTPVPKESKLLLDNNPMTEFLTAKTAKYPAQHDYYVSANGLTYGMPTVYDGNPASYSVGGGMTGEESLMLFESIRIK